MKRTICISLCLLLYSIVTAGSDRLGLTTVVIDAGHGGKDPGAVSKDGKLQEKSVTLDIAKRLSEMIRSEYPDVKVILTRKDDSFIPLNKRADIANKAGANLFISIHINSARNTSASGYSVHVMGKSTNRNTDVYELNMDAVKRENSVIMLEDDYTASYEGFDPSDPESFIFLQLMQNAYQEQSLDFARMINANLNGGPIRNDRGIWQNGFVVLFMTSMPSVLVELGFISNASDRDIISKSDNRSALAKRLFESFAEYKNYYDRSVNAVADDSLPVEISDTSKHPVKSNGIAAGPETESEVRDARMTSTEDNSDARYGVQIFAGSFPLTQMNTKAFMGYEPLVLKSGKLYKYIISVSEDPAEPRKNLPTIRKTYPDAFIVRISGGEAKLYK